jgi:hypothetical protein
LESSGETLGIVIRGADEKMTYAKYWLGKCRKNQPWINKRKNTMMKRYGKLSHGRNKTTIYSICLICKKIYSGPRWYMKNRKYCSNKCVGERNKGDNNPAKQLNSRKKISKALTGRHLSQSTKDKKSLYLKNLYIKHPERLKIFVDAGKKNTQQYITASKYKVRSMAEREIANWLFKNNIFFLYEEIIIRLDGYNFIPDFYLPKYKLYIEYYGNFRHDNRRTLLKKYLYKKYKIKVLQIDNIGYKKIEKYLEESKHENFIN